jgi:hypothetical protein
MSTPIDLDLSNVVTRIHDLTPPSEARKLFHWNLDGQSLTLRLDWSSLQAFSDCNKKGKYLLVDAITGAKSPALVFGAAVHAGLETLYNTPDRHNDPTLPARISLAIQEEFDLNPVSLFDDYRTADFAMEVMRQYMEHYKAEVMQPVTFNDTKLVEFGFSFPIGEVSIDSDMFEQYGYGTLTNDAKKESVWVSNCKLGDTFRYLPCIIEWTGVVDLVTQIDNQIWVCDHKTTSILSSDFTDGFEMAPQPIGYLSAINKLLPTPAAGFMLNGLICRKQTKTGKGIEFTRRFYTYEDWQYTEWTSDILMLIEEFLNNLSTQNFPGRRNSCLMKWGKCPYFDTCSLNPSVRHLHINSGVYTRNIWKPV